MSEIEKLLLVAWQGGKEHRKAFYQQLLECEVLLPVVGNLPKQDLAQIGVTSLQSRGLCVVRNNNKTVVPCFSSEALLKSWMDSEDAAFSQMKFTSFIQLVPEETWVHLNPGAVVGKEFSPWEVSLLQKSGNEPDAVIEEIVSELELGIQTELEVNPITDLFNPLKAQLLALFEVFPEVEEAFLVSARNDEDERYKPLLGLSIASDDAIRQSQIRQEIVFIAQRLGDTQEKEQPEDISMDEISIITDLQNRHSANWALFEGVTPFYFRPLPTRTDSVCGVSSRERVTRWLGKIKSKF